MTPQRRIRILFGVPGGDTESLEFNAAAEVLPDADIRFLSFLWSTGVYFRNRRMQFRHTPWKVGNPVECALCDIKLPIRGYTYENLPPSVKNTFFALQKWIRSQFAEFKPDVVVYGPTEHPICFIMDVIAEELKIPRLCIMSSFLKDHFLVQKDGAFTERGVLNQSVPENPDLLHQPVPARRLPPADNHKTEYLWFSRLERIGRCLSGGSSFDTINLLLSRLIQKIVSKPWFSDCKPLLSLDDAGPDYLLVLLNQPVESLWHGPNCFDMVRLVLKAAPGNVPVVIRPHPHERRPTIPPDVEELLRSHDARISRISNGPDLSSLIKHCRAVITLNSATGMEALLAGKPVFTLLPAYYTRPGMAHLVSSADSSSLRDMLENHRQYAPDPTVMSGFMSQFLRDHAAPHSYKQVDIRFGKPLVEHIFQSLAEMDS